MKKNVNIKGFEIDVSGFEAGAHVLLVRNSVPYQPAFVSGFEKQDWIVIDQYPACQQEIIISEQLEKNGGQLFVVTHSPFVLRAATTIWVKECFAEWIEDGLVWHKEASEKKAEINRIVYGNILDAYGTGLFSAH